MKVFKKKWVIPVAAAVLVLSIAGGAYAAASTSAPGTSDTSSAAEASDTTGTTDATSTTAVGQSTAKDGTCNDGDERGDRGSQGGGHGAETALTGDTLEKVKAAALASLGTGATVVRAETDAEGNAAYEVHATKADGTDVTVYVDESFQVVKTDTTQQGDRGGAPSGDGTMGRGHKGGDQGPGQGDSTTSKDKTGTTGTTATPGAATTGAI